MKTSTANNEHHANSIKKKNVLLIVVDQWRGDTLKKVGHKTIRTPNIDKLSERGVTFANHYTQAIPCGPGRASLLTGMYMMNHRVVQNTIPLDARHTNIAYEVRKVGYHPALIGYTTTTPDPRVVPSNDPRFSVLGAEMEGWDLVGSWGLKMEKYFAWLKMNGITLPENPWNIWLPEGLEENEIGATRKPSRIPNTLSDTHWFTDKAIEYLQGVEGKPWFLHLGYYRPHPPFAAPYPYNEMYDPADSESPINYNSLDEAHSVHPLYSFYLNSINRDHFFQNGQGKGAEMDNSEIKQMRATYYGLMSEVDDQLGRVFDYLEKSNQLDNTLIIFTSDHGEQLGDFNLLGKIGYFDQSFHIPMIVVDPTKEADKTRGKLVTEFTETIDMMPTVLEWLNMPIPRSCDGYSLLPFIYEDTTPEYWRTEVHYEFDFRNVFYSKPEEPLGVKMDEANLAVIQDKEFKYVHFTTLPPLFFDLRTDPKQLRNVAKDPSYHGKMLEYTQKMLSWRLGNAERTLTGYAATPKGLVSRDNDVMNYMNSLS